MRSASESEASSRSAVRAFTTAVIARETLKDVATLLGERGIPVMPLKGVLFQLLLYPDPAARRLCDVDVLVPEARFAEAIEVLVQHGYRPASAGPSWIEAALESPRGLPVDLHRRVFCALRYRMPTHEQFARATLDEQQLGVALHLQHPLDSLAHLVGKFVSDHVHAEATARLAEIERLVAHYALEPGAAARHLERCGLGRAARHVFSRAAREREHEFHAALLAELPGGVMTAAVVELAGRLARRFEHGPLAPLSAHLLNTSLWRGACSLLLAVAYTGEHARLRRAGGKRGGYWAPFFSAASRSARRRASSARPV
ncbi:MAG TPA: nucleotidyltransferase family protein [Polyangiaceae bacterium]|nr:nucleotidyltransferase family protein [Polyangiaceae bacterium]